jgi:hypothetical protein
MVLSGLVFSGQLNLIRCFSALQALSPQLSGD